MKRGILPLNVLKCTLYADLYIRFEPYNVSDIVDILDLNGLTLVILLRFYQLKIGLLMQFSVSNITNDNNCNAVEHSSACISHFYQITFRNKLDHFYVYICS